MKAGSYNVSSEFRSRWANTTHNGVNGINQHGFRSYPDDWKRHFFEAKVMMIHNFLYESLVSINKAIRSRSYEQQLFLLRGKILIKLSKILLKINFIIDFIPQIYDR